jgi:branched-chain amino acid aminotransferase
MFFENYYNLNGVIKPIEDFTFTIPSNAKIVYEVLRVKNSTPIFFEQHLDRLFNSISLLGFSQPNRNSINEMITDLLIKNPVFENNIRLSLVYNSRNNPDILIYFIPSSYPTQFQMDNGVILKTLHANRENPNAKVENTTLRVQADRIIDESGCYEVILIDNNGFITEGSRSNIFLIKNDTIFTPPLNMVLGGITRQVLIEISKGLEIPLKEEQIPVERLNEFDSAFITGTSPGVLPISLIESKILKVNNPILQRLIDEYNGAIATDIANFRKKSK